MLVCDSCGTELSIDPNTPEIQFECPLCGIDLELVNNQLIGWQLGPSEE